MRDSEVLCAELGITYRQLDYWARKGYLRPVQHRRTKHRYEATSGSGYKRVWPERELQVAREIRRLQAAGFTLEGGGGWCSCPGGERVAPVTQVIRDRIQGDWRVVCPIHGQLGRYLSFWVASRDARQHDEGHEQNEDPAGGAGSSGLAPSAPPGV